VRTQENLEEPLEGLKMGEVWVGHGEGILVGLKEVLANRSATQESRAWLRLLLLSQGGELLTQTEDNVGWWKELVNLTSMVEQHGSLPIQSACALWTWRRLMTVFPGEYCGGTAGVWGTGAVGTCRSVLVQTK